MFLRYFFVISLVVCLSLGQPNQQDSSKTDPGVQSGVTRRNFQRRVKSVRSERHRHSTRVKSLAPSLILLPPFLRENEGNPTLNPFIINVAPIKEPRPRTRMRTASTTTESVMPAKIVQSSTAATLPDTPNYAPIQTESNFYEPTTESPGRSWSELPEVTSPVNDLRSQYQSTITVDVSPHQGLESATVPETSPGPISPKHIQLPPVWPPMDVPPPLEYIAPPFLNEVSYYLTNDTVSPAPPPVRPVTIFPFQEPIQGTILSTGSLSSAFFDCLAINGSICNETIFMAVPDVQLVSSSVAKAGMKVMTSEVGLRMHNKRPNAQTDSIESEDRKSLSVAETGDFRNKVGPESSERSYNELDTTSPKSKGRIRDLKQSTNVCSKLGYIADVSTGCRVFYICVGFGVGEPMFCPSGTVFNQDFQVCDWWYNVDCKADTKKQI